MKKNAGKTAALVVVGILDLLLAAAIVCALIFAKKGSAEVKPLVSEKKMEEASSEDTDMLTVEGSYDEDWTFTPDGGYAAKSTSSTDSQSSSEYILPDSASRALTEDDLKGLTKDELRIARNEIYARHGRKFDSEDLQTYFDGKSWYQGTISPDDFDAAADSYISAIEKANAEFIKEHE